jgi:hypothetical protein
MGAIADLWKSERGLLAVLLVAAAGTLAGLGHMTTPQWTEFAQWIFVTYTAGKTVTGALEIARGTPPGIAVAVSPLGAIGDLWKSERGLLAVLLVVTAAILAGLGNMTTTEWTDFSKWIFITYAAGKTVTGAFQIAKGGTADPERPAPQPAPEPAPVEPSPASADTGSSPTSPATT